MKRNYKKAKTFQIKTKVMTRNDDALYLVIVESPSKCAKIEAYLGPQYQCIASRGHIRELAGLKSIDIKNNFEPTFQIAEDKREWVDAMRHVIQQFPKNRIILATDNDREGEAIAYHICRVFDLPIDTTLRILFTEITKTALQTAIRQPTKIDMRLVDAQQARQVLDIIIGFKISPLLWKYLYHSKSAALSAGRVQSPVLRLIYDNNIEFEKTEPQVKYKTSAYLLKENLKFDLLREFDTTSQIEDFLEKSKDFPHRPTLGEKAISKRAPPKPFNTSRLLQTANNALRYSPKQTMQYAQELYQAGYITYMRTENTKYSADFLDMAKRHILGEFGSDRYLGNLSFLENTDKNNPHEAVRVTNLAIKSLETSNKAAALYRLIWRTTMESCMSEAEYDTYRLGLTGPDDLAYSHSLEIPRFCGWKAVEEGIDGLDTHLAKMGGILFHIQTLVKSGKPVSPNWIESKVVVHRRHHHYTESTLIQRMESLGIGRPSTYALMVDTVQERGYVKCEDLEGMTINCDDYVLRGTILEKTTNKRTFGNEKQRLAITPLGKTCIEFLIQHFDAIFAYEYTKLMEDDLDKIATDPESGPWYSMCAKYYDEVVRRIKPVSKVHKESYRIDDQHEFQFQAYGPTVKRAIANGYEYLPVKKSAQIDLDRLKSGGYTLAELVEFETPLLGKYQDSDLFIRVGEFGPYFEWGDNKKSIRDIAMPLSEVKLSDAVAFLEKGDDASEVSGELSNTPNTIIREIDPNTSIRRGKFGHYIYYKTKQMKAPKFINLKKFQENYLECDPTILRDWIKTEGDRKTKPWSKK